jgi:hypothetical protein
VGSSSSSGGGKGGGRLILKFQGVEIIKFQMPSTPKSREDAPRSVHAKVGLHGADARAAQGLRLLSVSKRRKSDPKRTLNTIFEGAVQAMWDENRSFEHVTHDMHPPPHMYTTDNATIAPSHMTHDMHPPPHMYNTDIWDENRSFPFRSAVNCPQYRALIANPIDLKVMKTRCYGLGRFESAGLCRSEALYDSKEEFVADVAKMVSNCRTYNELRNPQLVSDVLELEQICHAKLEQSKSAIVEAEAMIALGRKLAAWTQALMTAEVEQPQTPTSTKVLKFEAFVAPVTTKEYSTVIKQPMDLKSVMSKAQSYSYCSHHGWLEDLRLVRDNCHLFCATRHPDLPPIADQLLARGEALAGEDSGTLQTLEGQVAQRERERAHVRESKKERDRKRERELEQRQKEAKQVRESKKERDREREREKARERVKTIVSSSSYDMYHPPHMTGQDHCSRSSPRVARERLGVVPGGKRLLELVSARPQGALGEHGRVEGCARRAMGGVRRSTAVRGRGPAMRWQSPTLSIIEVTPPREFDIASEVFARGGELPGGDFKDVTRALAWCNPSWLE